MAIRTYDEDPRTARERDADDSVLDAFGNGRFLQVEPAQKHAARERLRARNETFRQWASEIGFSLGELRRALGIPQSALAAAAGVSKSNISRTESGTYDGLSLKGFLRQLDALRSLSGPEADLLLVGARTAFRPMLSHPEFAAFDSPGRCLESVA